MKRAEASSGLLLEGFKVLSAMLMLSSLVGCIKVSVVFAMSARVTSQLSHHVSNKFAEEPPTKRQRIDANSFSTRDSLISGLNPKDFENIREFFEKPLGTSRIGLQYILKVNDGLATKDTNLILHVYSGDEKPMYEIGYWDDETGKIEFPCYTANYDEEENIIEGRMVNTRNAGNLRQECPPFDILMRASMYLSQGLNMSHVGYDGSHFEMVIKRVEFRIPTIYAKSVANPGKCHDLHVITLYHRYHMQYRIRGKIDATSNITAACENLQRRLNSITLEDLVEEIEGKHFRKHYETRSRKYIDTMEEVCKDFLNQNSKAIAAKSLATLFEARDPAARQCYVAFVTIMNEADWPKKRTVMELDSGRYMLYRDAKK